MSEAARVAVVGGGYAGLAAAVELTASGINVTVFEAGSQLGGRARRVDYSGMALDNGLHILIGAYTETLRLIRLVNPNYQNALRRLPLTWHMHPQFQLVAAHLPSPLHLLVGTLRAQGLTLAERMSVLRFMAALRKSGFIIERDIGVEQLLEQHGQSEKLRAILWRPLCISALNTPPRRASARIFLNVIKASLAASRSASDILIAREDLSALFPEPAARWLEARGGEVMREQRVTGIDPTEDKFSIRTHARSDDFTHVICALPPHQINAFLIGISALNDIAQTVDQLEYEPIYSIWLQYPDSITLPAPMMGLPDSTAQWIFDREKLCGQRGLLGVVISARGPHQNLTQDELAVRVHQELAQRLGPLPAPLWHRVIAEKRATFSCTVGVQRPPQITPLKNFYLAGDYTASAYPGTLESAVRSGIACAHHIRDSSRP